jgi:hypothetical protein
MNCQASLALSKSWRKAVLRDAGCRSESTPDSVCIVESEACRTCIAQLKNLMPCQCHHRRVPFEWDLIFHWKSHRRLFFCFIIWRFMLLTHT